MKSWGVEIASERKLRSEAKELVADNVRAELAPLTFSSKGGGEEVKQVPLAYIPHLWEMVEGLLNENDANDRLVLHIYR